MTATDTAPRAEIAGDTGELTAESCTAEPSAPYGNVARPRVARGPRRTYLDAAAGERGSGNVRSLVNLAGGGVQLASSSARPDGAGGEWDFWNAFSTRDRRRLGSLGFTARGGMSPDTFAEVLVDSGTVPSALVGDAGSICEWWLRNALTAADESARSAGEFEDREAAHYAELEAEEAGTVPTWLEEWTARLVCAGKREYALAYWSALVSGDVAPSRPAGEWARKVESKLDRRFAAMLGRGEV